jgi:hypothetical protein
MDPGIQVPQSKRSYIFFCTLNATHLFFGELEIKTVSHQIHQMTWMTRNQMTNTQLEFTIWHGK